MNKPQLGFFKFSCCTGCAYQVFYAQEHAAEVLTGFEIVYARLISSGGSQHGPFDLALIEGTVTESWQVDELRQIRANSKILIPIGSCAVIGGIPAIKSTQPELDVEKRVYTDLSVIHSIRPHPIDSYVKVDGYIRGCPPGERDLTEALTSVVLGKKPDFIQYSVCVECKLKGNICMLVSEGRPCMGPVTNAGCGAICPSNNRPCYSCFGPLRHSNAPALARKFKQMGMSKDDIIYKFTLFGADTIEFKKAVESLYED